MFPLLVQIVTKYRQLSPLGRLKSGIFTSVKLSYLYRGVQKVVLEKAYLFSSVIEQNKEFQSAVAVPSVISESRGKLITEFVMHNDGLKCDREAF